MSQSSSTTYLEGFSYNPRRGRYGWKTKKWRQARTEELAKPSDRRMEDLLKNKGQLIPTKCSMKIKGNLEEKHFKNPWSTENYFRERESKMGRKKPGETLVPSKKEWLSKFSAEIARMMSNWMMQHFECGVSPKNSYSDVNELSEIILDKICVILQEAKPERKDSERLSRFMVAVSDRLAVWMDDKIQNLA